MNAIVLAMALMAQDPGAMKPPIDPVLADLEFAMAVEEGIKAIPGTSPPEPYNRLLMTLGSARHPYREIASRGLLAASREDVRWLFWGRASRDAEVRRRCDDILWHLFPCPECGRSGHAKFSEYFPCGACQGNKTSWLWSRSD
jgi:hypothetical protein